MNDYHKFLACALASGLVPPVAQRPEPVPPKKKCFRHGCDNPREGNKLYCSKQCRELHLLAGNMPRDTELPITKIPDQGVITHDTSNT